MLSRGCISSHRFPAKHRHPTNMLFLGAFQLWLLAVVGTTVTSAAAYSSTDIPDLIITVPLAALSGDRFYNAYVNDVPVRLDMVQPDVWIPDPLYQLYCSYSNSSGNASDSLDCNDEATSMYPVLDDAYTTTYSDSDGEITQTMDLVTPLNNYVSIAYPNGIVAEGEAAMADLHIVDSNNDYLPLREFNFVYANHTNMMAGGLGLSNHPRGTGFLDYFLNKDFIKSRGYSAFLQNGDKNGDAYGELLIGGVNKKYFTGDLVSFPVLPYEGLDSGSTLPTVLLTDLRVVNGNTSQSVSLFSGDPEPVLLDPRMSINFLPLDAIIKLALQTNAFYNQERDVWIVKCSDLEDNDAEFLYSFGPLTIRAPLSSFLYSNLNDTGLTFSSGSKACPLNVNPSSSLGYSCLGLPFLTYAYVVMDNDGGNIALANKNDDHKVGTKLYTDFTPDTSTSLSSSSSSVASGSLSANHSASYIRSGSIPWASSYNVTQTNTITFGSANSSAAEDILTRYSQASIISGEVIVTRDAPTTVGPTTHVSSHSKTASAAAGHAVMHWEQASSEKTLIYATILLAGLLGGLII